MNNRRNLLKSIAAVGAVTAWEKPVVKSVLTPAHASTTGCGINGIVVSFEMTNVGTSGNEYGGDGGFGLWDVEDNILFGDGFDMGPNSTGSFVREFSNLSPGIYYFDGALGGGGAPGTALSASMNVSCCNDSARVTVTGESDFGRQLYLIIQISDDGSCSITQTSQEGIPPFPGN